MHFTEDHCKNVKEQYEKAIHAVDIHQIYFETIYLESILKGTSLLHRSNETLTKTQ